MTETSVTHATFVLERTFDVPPARVFQALSDPEEKARWFHGGSPQAEGYELDFRVGGREINHGGPEGGPLYKYEGVIRDIVPDQRIVLTADMYMDDTRISVSVGTWELKPTGDGTRLTVTEQGAFLDGHEDPKQREGGTAVLLDQLAEALKTSAAA